MFSSILLYLFIYFLGKGKGNGKQAHLFLCHPFAGRAGNEPSYLGSAWARFEKSSARAQLVS